MLHDALELADDGPVAIRYPKGTARQVGEHEVGVGLHARQLRARRRRSVCILAIGKLVDAPSRRPTASPSRASTSRVWDVAAARRSTRR